MLSKRLQVVDFGHWSLIFARFAHSFVLCCVVCGWVNGEWNAFIRVLERIDGEVSFERIFWRGEDFALRYLSFEALLEASSRLAQAAPGARWHWVDAMSEFITNLESSVVIQNCSSS